MTCDGKVEKWNRGDGAKRSPRSQPSDKAARISAVEEGICCQWPLLKSVQQPCLPFGGGNSFDQPRIVPLKCSLLRARNWGESEACEVIAGRDGQRWAGMGPRLQGAARRSSTHSANERAAAKSLGQSADLAAARQPSEFKAKQTQISNSFIPSRLLPPSAVS